MVTRTSRLSTLCQRLRSPWASRTRFNRSFTIASSVLERARRRPQSARVHAIEVKREHPCVEVERGFRRLRDAIEVADVLPRLFEDPRVVVALPPFVSGDHRARTKTLNRVEGRDPLASEQRVRFREIKVNVVVGSVSGNYKSDRRNMQTSG